ncbi:tRNA dihydrouridine synthase DusB [bacterium]|nr:tRNA dihydrouridine synthase DusB [bacterium]
MDIGNLKIKGQAVLAPLAGVGNLPFRRLCRGYGAALVYSEMLSCHGIMRNQPNTLKMLATEAEEHPLAFQLFGADPDIMAEASVKLAQAGADMVDLNFGCPVPKVVRHRGGSALLKEPALLQSIVVACVKKCPVPVTVKIRIGWDQSAINAIEIAQRVEAAGAAAIAVHARTRAQRFEGRADWRHIQDVVNVVTIPVIGNGDILSGPDAKAMLDQTGCAAVMVGRGAMGRPWVFQNINQYLQTGETLLEPGWNERVGIIRGHYQQLKALKGGHTARLEMRKHTAWYLKGLRGASVYRRQVNTCETEAAFLAVLDSMAAGPLS